MIDMKIGDIINAIKNLFHKDYAYDISNPFEIVKVKLKAYNQDENSFIVENINTDRYLPKKYMISRTILVLPLSKKDKKTIETITNAPFSKNGYCVNKTYKDRKEIVNCEIISLIDNTFLLVQFKYPILDMTLNIYYKGGYKILKMEEFMVKKN